MMKNRVLTLVLGASMLLLLSACGAEAKQQEEPALPPQEISQEVQQTQPAPKESEEPKVEQEEPEVQQGPAEETEPVSVEGTSAPEEEAVIEPVPATTEWEFTDCNETVYAISTVNLRSGPSTDFDKVDGLKTGDSITRVGIGYGDCEGWSIVKLSDGSIVYVSSNYISTSKPVVKQNTGGSKQSGGTSQTSKPSGGTQSSTPSGGTQSSGTSEQQWAESRGQGLAGLNSYESPYGTFEEGTNIKTEDSNAAVHMG